MRNPRNSNGSSGTRILRVFVALIGTRKFSKPSVHPEFLDAPYRLAIHPGCPAVAAYSMR